MRDTAPSHQDREYGRTGIFGLLTPQANPTVEPEFGILLPPSSVMLTARLTSPASSLRDRLIMYLTTLPDAIAQFGNLAPDAIGFACTGSSYLFDPSEERRIIQPIEDAKNCPVITAAQAVKGACASLGIRKIALISPYPPWLTAACQDYWERSGLTVTAALQLPTVAVGDRHGIYELTTQSVLASARAFSAGNADAILVTGTGMPSLRLILALEEERRLPVLSSNLCLAWALNRAVGQPRGGDESRLYGGWRERLANA